MGYKMHGMTQELEESQEVRAVMVGCTGKTLAEWMTVARDEKSLRELMRSSVVCDLQQWSWHNDDDYDGSFWVELV